MVDYGKDIKKAFDNGFVTGVLALASKFELEEVDVAAFLEGKHHIDFNSIDEPKRTWYIKMLTSHGLQDDDPPMEYFEKGEEE